MGYFLKLDVRHVLILARLENVVRVWRETVPQVGKGERSTI